MILIHGQKEAEVHYCQLILAGIQLSKKFESCFSDHLLQKCVHRLMRSLAVFLTRRENCFGI
jgi:hypothetical protein